MSGFKWQEPTSLRGISTLARFAEKFPMVKNANR